MNSDAKMPITPTIVSTGIDPTFAVTIFGELEKMSFRLNGKIAAANMTMATAIHQAKLE